MLVLLLQAGSVSAQTVTFSGGTSIALPSYAITDPCGTVTGATVGVNTLLNDANVTATASSPVNSMSILVASLGQGSLEGHIFDVVGVTGEVVSVPTACSSLLTVVGNSVRNLSAANSVVARITISSAIPFTQVIISNDNSSGLSGNDAFVITSGVQTTACAAGSTGPTLSTLAITNSCPTSTINLNSLVTSATPSGATLKWYSDNTHTTEVTNPTAVAASGFYYAFYVDTVNNCYSPSSLVVTATVNLCPLNISNTCPSPSVDLALSHQGTVPNGYTLTFHSGTPATDANKITNLVTASGTYYGAYYFAGQTCYSATGRPLVVTITNCCAAQTLPDLTN